MQHAQNERFAQLMAYRNYLSELMGVMTGVPLSLPQVRIPQPIYQNVNRGPTLNHINIDRSIIGMLNTGSIQDVQQIDINVKTIAEAGQVDIANAIKALTEAVASSKDVSDQQRTEILDQLNLVSSEAAIPAPSRKTGIIKPVLTGLATGISAVGSLAKLWAMFGDTICSYFGVENPFKGAQ